MATERKDAKARDRRLNQTYSPSKPKQEEPEGYTGLPGNGRRAARKRVSAAIEEAQTARLRREMKTRLEMEKSLHNIQSMTQQIELMKRKLQREKVKHNELEKQLQQEADIQAAIYPHSYYNLRLKGKQFVPANRM